MTQHAQLTFNPLTIDAFDQSLDIISCKDNPLSHGQDQLLYLGHLGHVKTTFVALMLA